MERAYCTTPFTAHLWWNYGKARLHRLRVAITELCQKGPDGPVLLKYLRLLERTLSKSFTESWCLSSSAVRITQIFLGDIEMNWDEQLAYSVTCFTPRLWNHYKSHYKLETSFCFSMLLLLFIYFKSFFAVCSYLDLQSEIKSLYLSF